MYFIKKIIKMYLTGFLASLVIIGLVLILGILRSDNPITNNEILSFFSLKQLDTLNTQQISISELKKCLVLFSTYTTLLFGSSALLSHFIFNIIHKYKKQP